MFGFGDRWPPQEESVQLVESLVTQYIENLTRRASKIGELRGNLDKECFLYLVSTDRRKFQRVCTLLDTNEEIKSVQKDIKDDT